LKQEIEAKFLSVDIESVRQKLKDVGAECSHPMRLMRRAIIDYPDNRLQHKKDSYIRIRDEGDKTTLTYKQFTSLEIGGALEIETIVTDFEATIQIFNSIGLITKSFQESKRETWVLDGTEIVIDQWPWLNPYIEIEADDESSIKLVAQKLNFAWENAVFGDVMVAYRAQYPALADNYGIGNVPQVRFNDKVPEIFTK
jgi:adenylate cyclase class 2